MNFISSWLCCLSSEPSDSSTLIGTPLMSHSKSKRHSTSSQFSSNSNSSSWDSDHSYYDENPYSTIIDQINPFIYTVQCTVSARTAYPSRPNLISVNSFIDDYDQSLPSLNRASPSSLAHVHLNFHQGDDICVLGQYGGMLVGYLDRDPNRSVGFFEPDLVYVDLTSIKSIELNSSLLPVDPPPSAYTRRTMHTLPK